MKRFITSVMLVCASLISTYAKSGILVAQFGTSNEEGRISALDPLFNDIKTAFGSYEVREAYTSPTIRRILSKKGLHKDSVTDALLRMHLDGIDTVFVQPTFLLDGVEMQMLRQEAANVSQFFSMIDIGTPMLHTIDDFKLLTSIISKDECGKKEAIMYVGHGNEYASTSAYTMLASMLHAQGAQHSYVGTIEGWPDLEVSVSQLKNKGYKKVTLVPLLMACGVHAREDIDGEWRPAIESLGYAVDVRFQGLCERQEIRQLIITHLSNLLAK